MNPTTKLLTAFLAATLLFGSCQKEKDCDGTAKQTFDLTGFSRIKAGSALKLTIKRGDTYSISAEGCRRDVGDLRLSVGNGENLEIDFDENRLRRDAVQVEITLPRLTALNLSGAAEGTVSGFAAENSNMRMVLSGASAVLLDGTTQQTQIELSGASRLEAKEQTGKLYGQMSGGSELKAFETRATEVDLHASGASRAFVQPVEILRAEATGGSRITYKGNPAIKDTNTSGGGQIVAQ